MPWAVRERAPRAREHRRRGEGRHGAAPGGGVRSPPDCWSVCCGRLRRRRFQYLLGSTTSPVLPVTRCTRSRYTRQDDGSDQNRDAHESRSCGKRHPRALPDTRRSENDTPRGQSWKRVSTAPAAPGNFSVAWPDRRAPERARAGRCPPGVPELLPPLICPNPRASHSRATRTGVTARREGRAEVGRSGCARRSATVRPSQREALDSRTVAHSRGRSQQGETGMAFKRSGVRLSSAPLHHSLGLTDTERSLNSTTDSGSVGRWP